MEKERLVVIDGHALIHRAYHAIPPLTTRSGELVNAVYGFTVILLNVLRDLHPEYAVVAFDLPGKTKRHEEYEAYKANRVKAPDDLVRQFERVKDVVRAFDIPIFEQEGYEADDVIGTISKHAPKNIETVIVTGDMDELQLVDEKTKVYTMRRGFSDTVIYDRAAIKAKYGLTPEEFIDYKALKGDPSDNIPGVSGVGEKTATELIKTYGSLDRVYKNLDKIKPTLAEKLKKEKEIAYLSQKLSRIETNLPIKVDLQSCYVHRYDRQKVIELFGELEFRSLLSKIPGESPLKAEAVKFEEITGEYFYIDSDKKLTELAGRLQKAKQIAVSVNFIGNPHQSKPLEIGLADQENEAFTVPLNKPDYLEKLKPILQNSKIAKVGHDLKSVQIILQSHDCSLEGTAFDTMIAAYLLNPNAKDQKIAELSMTELKQSLEGDEKLRTARESAAILRLFKIQKGQLQQNDLLKLMEDIEVPLITILARMEMTGIRLDTKKLEKLSLYADKRIEQLDMTIRERAGQDFNIASPSQLQEILFGKLKLQDKLDNPKDLKKLKSGDYSTAASELEKLRGINPIIDEIFEYRELTKLKNTYIDVLPKLISPKDHRIHTSYNQTVAQTGRLSSSDPNLQNIPVRTEIGKKIREAFVAAPGNVLLSADYSQIELRVIAHLAQDTAMKEVFTNHRDIHTETAASVYNVPDKKVTPKMRRIAKIINFGIIYGVSAHGLRQQTGVSYEEGRNLIEKYFSIHPNIKNYSDKMIAQAKELGYVETIFGRRRYLPEIHSSNFAVRGAAERMAINMPVQGTAADLIKLAMIDIDRELSTVSPKTKLLLQVHDELVFEVPEEEVEKVAQFVANKMNGVIKLNVPIETSIHWGDNWEAAK
jgi:DNA polymerase-1